MLVTFLALLGLALGLVNSQGVNVKLSSSPTEIYTDFIDLVEGKFRLYWNTTDKDLIGEIHCQTNSWVAFGISPNGGMDNSDVFIAWIDQNGNTNFTVNKSNKSMLS